MRLSPRDPKIGVWHDIIGFAEFGLGHYDASIDEYHKALDAGFRVYYVYADLAAALALEGKMEEAKTALAEARRLNPKVSVKDALAHVPDLPFLFDSQIGKYIFGLRKAGLPEE
jgi:adenylate cyclase